MCNLLLLFVSLSVCLYLVKCETNQGIEGAACKWGELEGRCVHPKRCLTTLDDRGEKPPVCAQKCEGTYICCADCDLVNDTSNAVSSPTGGLLWKDGRKFRDHCLQFLKDLPHKCAQDGYYGGIHKHLDSEKKCYKPILFAIGGAPPIGAELTIENPYEAWMGFGEDLESAMWYSSGAIINEKFILTSAHGHSTTEDDLPVKFAALGVRNRTEDKKNWQIRVIKKIHLHPLYDGVTRYHDLALIELDTPIIFNKNVLPACLPDPEAEFDISTAKAFSWKEPESRLSEYLDTPRKVEVKRFSAEECSKIIVGQENPVPILFNNSSQLPKGVNDTIHLCYGSKDEQLSEPPTYQPCLKVVGSPVVVNSQLSRCLNTVIGVNSYGISCGAVVYTKVAHYVPWIESVVWP